MLPRILWANTADSAQKRCCKGRFDIAAQRTPDQRPPVKRNATLLSIGQTALSNMFPTSACQ